MKAFCDTNVLLDVLLARKAFYAESAQVWTLAEAGRIQGLISVISFTNVHYIIRRLKNRGAARRAVVLLRDTFAAVPLDEQIINQAVDAGLKDFEDAIQFLSAVRAEADCIVTRDRDHFPADQLPIQTPAEFLATHFAE